MEGWREYESQVLKTEQSPQEQLLQEALLEEGALADAIGNLKKGLMQFFGAPKEFMKIVKTSKQIFDKDVVEMEKSLPDDPEFKKILEAMAARAMKLINQENPDMFKEMLVHQKQRILKEQTLNEEAKQNPIQELMDYISQSDDPELKRLGKASYNYHDKKLVETWESATEKASGKKVKLPENTRQFLLYVLRTSVGKLIFGIVDNYIMFLVGAIIDAALGNIFMSAGIAAALSIQLGMGVGNGISDATGIGVEETLEDDLRDIGLNPDSIDTEDLEKSPGYKSWWSLLNSKKWSMFVIFTGCILGMFPLFTGPIAGVGIAAAATGAFKGVVKAKKRAREKQAVVDQALLAVGDTE